MRKVVLLLLVWLTALGLGRRLLISRLERDAWTGGAVLESVERSSAAGDWAAHILGVTVLLAVAMVPPIAVALVWRRTARRTHG